MPCDCLRQPPQVTPQFTLTPIPRLRSLLVALLVKTVIILPSVPNRPLGQWKSLRTVMVSASRKRKNISANTTRVRPSAGRIRHRTGACACAAMRRHMPSNPRTGKITVSPSLSNLELSANLRATSPAVLALPFGVPPRGVGGLVDRIFSCFGVCFVVFVVCACLARPLAFDSFVSCRVCVRACLLAATVAAAVAWLSVVSSVQCLRLLCAVRLSYCSCDVLVLSSFVCCLCGRGPIGLWP